MHSLHHFHHVVLTFRISHIKLRKMRKIQCIRQRRHLISILHTGKGHKCSASTSTSDKVGHGCLRRIFLRSLRKMRHRIRGLHSVFQYKLADLDWGKQMGICVFHRNRSFYMEFYQYHKAECRHCPIASPYCPMHKLIDAKNESFFIFSFKMTISLSIHNLV